MKCSSLLLICLRNSTHCKLRCVGNFNRYVPLLNDIRARRGKACVRICKHLQAFIHETDANSELQRYTAYRAPLQAPSAILIGSRFQL